MSEPQPAQKPEPIQAARRKLFVQAIRDILPTTQEELRKLEERHRSENEEYLLGVTRDGYHVFNVDGEPIEYVPDDHIVYLISGNSFPNIPHISLEWVVQNLGIEDAPEKILFMDQTDTVKQLLEKEAAKQHLESLASISCRLTLQCPMCGKPIHTSIYRPVDAKTDIAVVGCPDQIDGTRVCMEYSIEGRL